MFMVVGLNHRTAPLAMRERFWISDNRRYDALRLLKSAEGIEEVLVLSTRCRTDFVLWASEPTMAANALLQYLGNKHGLKLSEWEHFYRRLDEAAITHVFRLACGLDCQVLCGSDAVPNLTAAWDQAKAVGASGSYLNLLLKQGLLLSERIGSKTAMAADGNCLPTVACTLARQVFGSLQGRRVLLLGTGKAAQDAARLMAESGASYVTVIDQFPTRAREAADTLGATAASLTDRWNCLLQTDIAISATGCPHFILTRDEAERIASERNRVALLVLDMEMPRDVDPEVRRVDGILLYDLDAMEREASKPTASRSAAAEEAGKIVAAEARAFRSGLQVQAVAPTAVALRQHFTELCRQELESFIAERGPFTWEQDQSLHAITSQVIQKIASSLARELKDIPDTGDQQAMTAAVVRLFHLESPPQAAAGTRSEKENDERTEEQPVAVNY